MWITFNEAFGLKGEGNKSYLFRFLHVKERCLLLLQIFGMPEIIMIRILLTIDLFNYPMNNRKHHWNIFF